MFKLLKQVLKLLRHASWIFKDYLKPSGNLFIYFFGNKNKHYIMSALVYFCRYMIWYDSHKHKIVWYEMENFPTNSLTDWFNLITNLGQVTRLDLISNIAILLWKSEIALIYSLMLRKTYSKMHIEIVCKLQ